jgi:hypothetical protein
VISFKAVRNCYDSWTQRQGLNIITQEIIRQVDCWKVASHILFYFLQWVILFEVLSRVVCVAGEEWR